MATKLEAFWLSVQSVMKGREPYPGVSLKGSASGKVPLPSTNFFDVSAKEIEVLVEAINSGSLLDSDSSQIEQHIFISRVILKSFEDKYTAANIFDVKLFKQYLHFGGKFSDVSIDLKEDQGTNVSPLRGCAAAYQKIMATGSISDPEDVTFILSGFYSSNNNLDDFEPVLDVVLSSDPEIKNNAHVKSEFYPAFLNRRPELLALCAVSTWPRNNVSQGLLTAIASTSATSQKNYLKNASQTVRKRFYAKRDLAELSALLPDDWTDSTILRERKKGHSVAKFYVDALLQEHLSSSAMRKLAYELFDAQPDTSIELTIASLV